MRSTIRSFTLPVGFMPSSFANSRTPAFGDRLRNSTSAVPPTISPISRAPPTPHPPRLPGGDTPGLKNRLPLVPKANLEGYYYNPRIDRELLQLHSAGLTALSGCPSAEFHRRIQEGDREGAVGVAKWYREVFDG